MRSLRSELEFVDDGFEQIDDLRDGKPRALFRVEVAHDRHAQCAVRQFATRAVSVITATSS
jgi:hypothetical protein